MILSILSFLSFNADKVIPCLAMNQDDFLHGERSDATEEDTISSEAVTSPVSTRVHDRVI